jgi:hypothetical protein
LALFGKIESARSDHVVPRSQNTFLDAIHPLVAANLIRGLRNLRPSTKRRLAVSFGPWPLSHLATQALERSALETHGPISHQPWTIFHFQRTTTPQSVYQCNKLSTAILYTMTYSVRPVVLLHRASRLSLHGGAGVSPACLVPSCPLPASRPSRLRGEYSVAGTGVALDHQCISQLPLRKRGESAASNGRG